MKQIKNKIILAAALLVTIAAVNSCTKKDAPAPPVPLKPTISSFNPTSAYSGDTVTISGTNFTGVTAVSFGETAAAFYKVESATSIKAVVGVGATGAVKVVAPGGAASMDGFALKAPKIDGYDNSNQVAAASLIGYWPFDGTPDEKIKNSAPILKGGTATYVDGKIGKAVSLQSGWFTYGAEATAAGKDNTGFNSNDTLQFGFTVSVWAQVNKTELLSSLFQLSTPGIPNWPILGLNYRKHDDNSFDIDGGMANVDGTGPHLTYAAAFMEPAFFDTSAWAHIVMTYNGEDKMMKYYANGSLKKTINMATLAGGPFPDANASLLMITPNYATVGIFESSLSTPGDASTTIPEYMSKGITGKVDDLRFFRAALTEKEVVALFHLGEAGR